MPDFDFSKYETADRPPTAGERKSAADVRKAEGEGTKLYATLPAVKAEADANAKVAEYKAAQLGWEKANEDFQKEYVVWRSGDSASTIANLKLLIDAVRLLENNKTLTGPIISRLPQIVREYYIPESEDVRNDVQKAIQASLRQTLGAQFTAEEGERINRNTFNPALPESMVAANVRGELNKVLDIAVSREAMSRYYEENNTLKGYKAEDWKPAVEAEFNPMEGVSEADQRAAAAANYRDGVNNIGGEPLKGFRFRPGEEQQILAYANSPEFTPEGYVNLVASLYENVAGVAPDMDALRAEAKDMADRPVGQRAGSVDYSQVDLAAMQAAGVDEKFIQALKNAPTSAVMLVSDLISPVTDAVKSAMLGERTGVYKSIPDLVADVAAKAGLGETDQETLNALSAVVEERYGGMDAIESTAVTDPFGLVADLSMLLTAGGTAAARAPGAVGGFGRKTAQVGRAIDPISFAGNVLSKATPEDLVNFARRAPAESVALTTGAPPSAFRQAFDVGAERQRQGVTTRSEAFRKGLTGKVDPSDLVADAKRAMQEVREAASQEYRSGMREISQDKSILAFDDIDIALQKMRADATFNGQVVDSAALAAVERMQPVVDQWRALDPATFHTPEGMDKLKQRIFDEVGNIPDDQRTVRRAAGTVYNAVKDTIKNQAPAYADVMAEYADASEVLGRMERELGLGRKVPIDTAASKLTERPPSRKGRDDLVSLLAEYDPVVGAEIAGEQLSRYFPQGLRGAGTGLGVAGGSAAGAFTNPLALLGATTISPRLMGEVAYGLGRASVPIGDAFSAVGRSPGTLLGTQRGLALAGQTDEELERLAYPYMTVPPAGDGMGVETGTPAEGQQPAAMRPAPPAEAGFTNVDVAGNEVAPPAQTTRVINGRITDIDPVTQQRVYLDTNEPVEPDAMKLGGMVRKYQAGGAVKGYREGGSVYGEADPEGFNRAVADYYASLRGMQPSEEVVSGLAAKYGVGTPTNFGEILDFHQRFGTLNPTVAINPGGAEPTQEASRVPSVSAVPEADYYPGLARAVAEGALFAHNDELEGAIRAVPSLFSGGFSGYGDAYGDEVARIRAQQDLFRDQYPEEYMAGVVGGSILPAVVPGGQAMTATRLASLAARAPGAKRAADLAVRGASPSSQRFIRGVPEVAVGSAFYGMGAAPSVAEIPDSVADEFTLGLGLYGAQSAAGAGGRRAFRSGRKLLNKVRKK
jgi:hypothetical protein